MRFVPIKSVEQQAALALHRTRDLLVRQRTSKMGDQYLRRLLVTGMTSLVRRNKHHPDSADPRINALLARSRHGKLLRKIKARLCLLQQWRGSSLRSPAGTPE